MAKTLARQERKGNGVGYIRSFPTHGLSPAQAGNCIAG